MLRLLADENFDNDIVRGLLRRAPQTDLVRVQDVGLAAAEDPDVLIWAAEENRILLTHDVATITAFAYERIAAGQAMPGVFEVSQLAPVGIVIEDLLLIIECTEQHEWTNQVQYIPLKS
ncbi:MAG: DUF5615 family PIN-like protein [Herpetosiphonaceae bacterium]|nr:DUF5615 family PIN-like protein [Herpetosiphonaceae bacterium]